jgi:hypothetical protein
MPLHYTNGLAKSIRPLKESVNGYVQPKDPAAAQVTIDTDKDTKVQVLRMWSALAPYDAEIQKNFEATENPDS